MIFKQTGELAPIDDPVRLIRDAVHDLSLHQEGLKSVKIRMWDWHRPYHDGICQQCLAGCSISRRLGLDSKISKQPFEFDRETEKKLIALDNFREGDVYEACQELGIPCPPGFSSFEITPYNEDPKEFKKDLLAMADALERAGI